MDWISEQNLSYEIVALNKLAETAIYEGLSNLKALTISNNMELFNALLKDKHLLSSLKFLKLSKIESKEVYKLISRLKIWGHLILSNIDLKEQSSSPDILFPYSLYKLEVVRWKLICSYFFDQLHSSKNNIVDLSLFDNEYDVLVSYTKMIKSFSQVPNHKITRLLLDDLFLSMHMKIKGNINYFLFIS